MFPFLAFETLEEFLAVTSSLSVDVWTSGRPTTWGSSTECLEVQRCNSQRHPGDVGPVPFA